MVKTRVHDLAAEFGVPAEQLLAMLKDMNIFVRSHMSGPGGRPGVRGPGPLGARKAEARRGAGAQEDPAQGGQGGARARAGGRRPSRPSAAAPPRRWRSRRPRPRPSGMRPRLLGASSWSARRSEMAESAPTLSLEERARALFKDLPPAPAEHGAEAEPPRRAGATPPAPSSGADRVTPPRGPRCPPAPVIPTRVPVHAAPQASRGRARRRSRPEPRPSRSAARPAGRRPSRGPGPPAARRRRPSHRRASARGTSAPTPRRAAARQEGEEGPQVVGRPGSGAGQHPQDAAGHARRRPQRPRPSRLSRSYREVLAGARPRSGSARRPGSGSTSSSRCRSSPTS